jgi:hypothetical protein
MLWLELQKAFGSGKWERDEEKKSKGKVKAKKGEG